MSAPVSSAEKSSPKIHKEEGLSLPPEAEGFRLAYQERARDVFGEVQKALEEAVHGSTNEDTVYGYLQRALVAMNQALSRGGDQEILYQVADALASANRHDKHHQDARLKAVNLAWKSMQKIYLLNGKFDKNKPTILFVQAIGIGPFPVFNAAFKDLEEKYNIAFTVSDFLRPIDQLAKELNEQVYAFNADHETRIAKIITLSYGFSVLARAVQMDDQNTYRQAQVVALSPMIGGARQLKTFYNLTRLEPMAFLANLLGFDLPAFIMKKFAEPNFANFIDAVMPGKATQKNLDGFIQHQLLEEKRIDQLQIFFPPDGTDRFLDQYNPAYLYLLNKGVVQSIADVGRYPVKERHHFLPSNPQVRRKMAHFLGVSFSERLASNDRAQSAQLQESLLAKARAEGKAFVTLANLDPKQPPVTLTIFPHNSTFTVLVSIKGEQTGKLYLRWEEGSKLIHISNIFPIGRDFEPTYFRYRNKNIASTILNWLAWEAGENKCEVQNEETVNIHLAYLFAKYFGGSQAVVLGRNGVTFDQLVKEHGLYGHEIWGGLVDARTNAWITLEKIPGANSYSVLSSFAYRDNEFKLHDTVEIDRYGQVSIDEGGIRIQTRFTVSFGKKLVAVQGPPTLSQVPQHNAAMDTIIKNDLREAIMQRIGVKIMRLRMALNLRDYDAHDVFSHYDQELGVYVIPDDVMNILGSVAEFHVTPQGFNFLGFIGLKASTVDGIKAGDRDDLYELRHEQAHNKYREEHPGDIPYKSIEQNLIDEIYAHLDGFISTFGRERLFEKKDLGLGEKDWFENVLNFLNRDYVEQDVEDREKIVKKLSYTMNIIRLAFQHNRDAKIMPWIRQSTSLDEILGIVSSGDQQEPQWLVDAGVLPANYKEIKEKWAQFKPDSAMRNTSQLQAITHENTGGIDLTAANMNLVMRNAGRGIKFHLDPAMLSQLQNVPGFSPVVINIRPLDSLEKFLGLNTRESLASESPS